tara:strand:+ start:2609 stop:3430 length:822 start_codon:yes stop_codon:yes gene_type:complete
MSTFILWFIPAFFISWKLISLYKNHIKFQHIPFSPLYGDLKIGSDYLDKYITNPLPPALGEVDDVSLFSSPHFDPILLSSLVKDFYEQTSLYTLTFEINWHHPFKIAAYIFSHFTSYIQQLNLPGISGTKSKLISQFFSIPLSIDPREGSRAWIRTNQNKEAVFVAFYATHKTHEIPYVNIAVPLPFSNLSTVLSIKNCGDGLELSTKNRLGDEGLYLVTRFFSIRLPLSQTFLTFPVLPIGESKKQISATHTMWVFGIKFLTLHYTAYRTTK